MGMLEMFTNTKNEMNADVQGALNQINKSYKAFTHNGKPMTKQQVKVVLEYALRQGYNNTGQLSDGEVDNVIAINRL